MTAKPPPTPEELILAMLRDVLARQAQQMGIAAKTAPAEKARPEIPAAPPEPPKPAAPSAVPAEAQPPPKPEAPRPVEPIFRPLPEDRPPTSAETSRRYPSGPARAPEAAPASAPEQEGEDRLAPDELEALAELNEIAARPFAPSGMAQTFRWIILGLAALVLVVNLPLFGGLAIVRATPSQPALVLYEGLLIRGSGAAVYVIENGSKRLLSSEEAFLQRGYRWSQVRVIDDETLNEVPVGPPIHVILKCPDSPNLYLLESGQKRFIADWESAQALGYAEADVRTVSCSRLRTFSDGLPIP
jgi:hypothetical protein